MTNEKVTSLIIENQKMVYSIANKYSTYYCLDDLYQVGIIGLIKATKKYNENINNKFSSYAYKYILGEIITFIKNDRNIKISDELFKIYKLYLKVKEKLCNVYQREATLNEICKFMDVDEKKLIRVIETVSFTKSIQYEENIHIDERTQIDNKILIDEEISLLDSLQKNIIDYRYFKGYNQEQTANLLGVSQSKVSREEKLVLNKMKKDLI